MTKMLADERVNILSTSPDRVGVSRFSFEMGNPEHLGEVLRPCGASRAYTTATA